MHTVRNDCSSLDRLERLCYNVNVNGIQEKEQDYGESFGHRMDGINLESSHWLHKGQSRVQALLCRAHGKKAKGNGAAQLHQWL